MTKIMPWDEMLAMDEECISVHIFAQHQNKLMFYLNCEIQNIIVSSIPKPCSSVDEAIDTGISTATKYNIEIVLVDDNRIEKN